LFRWKIEAIHFGRELDGVQLVEDDAGDDELEDQPCSVLAP